MKLNRIILGLGLMSSVVNANTFDTCPSTAFLFQGKPVQIQGVDLSTGVVTTLATDVGLTDVSINAVGFNQNDRYLYGLDVTNRQVVRVGSDFQAIPLNVPALPNITFIAGDVHNNKLYLYKSDEGLFTVDLAPLATDINAPLTFSTVTTTLSKSHADIAAHPFQNKIYAIEKTTRDLWEYDPTTGSGINRGNTGIPGSGGFGAIYFDMDGYLYAAENDSGKIYRIDLTNPYDTGVSTTAIEFVQGPIAVKNDGARCSSAGMTDADLTDFGDAPDSYATSLGQNGPRHHIDGTTYLGSVAPDGEGDAKLATSDDVDNHNDEDGVAFVTALEPGFDAIVRVEAASSGYLSAWFDYNQDGDFDDAGEKVMDDLLLTGGVHELTVAIDANAVGGNSWSRFRFSQQQGLNFWGGAASGEVEDHPIVIAANGWSTRYYPGGSGYATVAFEDNWPYTDDYDLNDMVVHYRVAEILHNGSVVKTSIYGRLAAYGASFYNGFAIRLKGLATADIDTTETQQFQNGALLTPSGLETDSQDATFIIANNLKYIPASSCEFYRTLSACPEAENFTFEIHATVTGSGDSSQLVAMPYDPFIFATPGAYHGDGLPVHPGRSLEIHTPTYGPTEKFDTNLLKMGEDNTVVGTPPFFQTTGHLPWGIIIPSEWKWPLERVELSTAYPQFSSYAESGGTSNLDWYDHPDTDKIYNH